MTQAKLILLPGLLNDGRVWQHQVEHLSRQAQVTIGDITQDDTVDAMARRVLAAAPPGPFALAGLSMGGYVALEIIRQAPQRVLGLALVGTSARPDTPEGSEGRRKQMQQAESDFEGVLSALLPKMVHADHVDDPQRGGLFLRMARDAGVAVFKRQQLANIHRVDSRPFLAQITCPTLVLHGRQDSIMLAAVQDELVSGIGSAQHRVVEDCGHLAPMEQPAAVTAALAEWLERIET
ncbi:alpha/beta fold hydrolase [Uliginosibacterium sp. H1]|uniref:alpha/beta fold hydrolase n=1 Tax=Uliginosibacterium sp. H1 TaxID=3114757 RepID=UPI002E17FB5F|nr:alpha/beta hydrolase [Uliginosibacterium sp. H1]